MGLLRPCATRARCGSHSYAMWTLVGIVTALLLVSWWIHSVNMRHEARTRALGPSGDERVAAAWESFGAHDSPEALSEELDTLVETSPIEALLDKNAVARVAIMALRAERIDLVRACADRVRELGPGCGEARTLGVLAAACEGDLDLARALYAESQSAIAGCGSCGASETARILSQEVTLLLSADPRSA
jgi:hypothetical protein